MTYRNSRREQVLDFYRSRLETTGAAPSCREAGEAIGMSSVGVWKHVQTLIGEGKLVKVETAPRGRPSNAIMLPEVALRSVPTDRLRGELARRGVTLDALEEPKLLSDEGRACAANLCTARVGRGKLMCREHWFRLPPKYRSDLMNAWSARHVQAFQDALEAARDYLGGYTRVVERVG